MQFKEAVRAGFSGYLRFEGRSIRSEFWYWTLFVMLVSFALGVLDNAAFGAESGGPLGLIWNLATILPSIAVGARRLHDTDRSGWWLLLILIPLIGIVVLIVCWCQRGTMGVNRFGPDPSAGTPATLS